MVDLAPFEVEVYVAGGPVIRLTLAESTLRDLMASQVMSTGEHGDRASLLLAAVTWLESMFDPRHVGQRTSIVDGEGAHWEVAPEAVTAFRVRDPLQPTGSHPGLVARPNP